MDAFQIVKKTIKEYEMAGEADRIVVGFSGGPDSTCLLHCLYRMFGSERLAAVHVNHLLRGLAAEEDARQAAEFCRARGISFFLCRAEVRALAARMKLSEEDAGRRTRYLVFEQVRTLIQRQIESAGANSVVSSGANSIPRINIDSQNTIDDTNWKKATDGSFYCEASAADLEKQLSAESRKTDELNGQSGRVLIAVAQNADDQAETVLMRILRGTGVSGLGAMEYVRKDGVIRPLLDVSRRSVEKYCLVHDLHPSTDATNDETDYTRNRVRLELLPYLRERFNPNIDQALNRLAAVARQDSSFIDDVSKRQLSTAVLMRGNAGESMGKTEAGEQISLDLDTLRAQHPAVRARVLLLALGEAGLSRNIAAAHLRGAERLIRAGKENSVAEFPQNFRMRIRRGRAEFYREKIPAAAAADQYELKVRELSSEETRSLPAEKVGSLSAEAERDGGETGGRGEVLFSHLFDGEAVVDSQFELALRTRKKGDHIRPLGMNGSKKLQDFLVDKKIPRELRDQLLLVCLGQEVVWAAGVPGTAGRSYIGEPYKVRSDSEIILEISIIRR